MLSTAAGFAGFFAARSLGPRLLQPAHGELVKPRQEPSAIKDTIPLKPANATQQRSAAIDPNSLFIGTSREVIAKALSSTANLPANVAIPRLAHSFLQRPYNAFSLDKTRNEVLRIDLTSFDCFLFVEQLLALVNSRNVSDYVKTVRDLRYDNAQVNYCSRYHYFTNWAENAIKMGLVLDLSRSLPHAVNRSLLLDYMSSHASSYEPMRQKKNRDCIAQRETSLIANQSFVPIGSVSAVEDRLQSGDIFALVTGVQGLDVTHVGFVIRDSNGLSAIHAAPGPGVMISSNFAKYASSVPDVIGIAIYRPLSHNIGL